MYGKGLNSREWIYVEDHCEALLKVYEKGLVGSFYNIGSNKNQTNIEICKKLLTVAKKNISIGKKVRVSYVKDRPGHDIRYALNSKKIEKKLNWKAKTNIKEGLEKTFLWYLENKNYYKLISKKDILKRFDKKNN